MIEIIVIVEADADFQIATKLAERVLVENIQWLEDEQLQYQLKWSGLESNTTYSCWKNMSQIIADLKQYSNYRAPRFLGRSKSGSWKADGAAAKKVLNVVRFLRRQRDIQAILLIRDLDNQPERRKGLEQARLDDSDRQPTLEIVLGTSDRAREAWVLNGFVPLNEDERLTLKGIKAQLTFDPCEDAHRLRSNSSVEPERLRNPKIVLDQLTEGVYERQRQCWEEPPLTLLSQRGRKTGLTTYLSEVGDRLVPLVRGE